MGEWVRDTSGTALKTTDAMLEKISELVAERNQLREDLIVAVEAAMSR